jgi:hypothetical protein
MHDPKPDTDAEREQSLPRCPDELTKRLLNLRSSGLSNACKVVTTVARDTFFMAVPPVLSDFVDAPNAPHRSGRDGRTAVQTSTRSRTTSG